MVWVRQVTEGDEGVGYIEAIKRRGKRKVTMVHGVKGRGKVGRGRQGMEEERGKGEGEGEEWGGEEEDKGRGGVGGGARDVINHYSEMQQCVVCMR